jgi:pyruvate,water dikinase
MLLADAAGLVVEEGGLIAHSAIVARELGIPAVIGASGACTRIQNMAMIEVDPSTGTVRCLDS